MLSIDHYAGNRALALYAFNALSFECHSLDILTNKFGVNEPVIDGLVIVADATSNNLTFTLFAYCGLNAVKTAFATTYDLRLNQHRYEYKRV